MSPTAPPTSPKVSKPSPIRRLALAVIPLLAVATGLLLAATPANAASPAPTHPFLFSLQGEVKERVPLPPPEGNLEDVCGVAVDSHGDIYLADYYHRRIDVYSPAHQYLTQIVDPDPDGPCGLAVDNDPASPSFGDLYVNHWHRNVVRFTPSQFPPTESTRYATPTTIDSARSTGVAVDPASGNVYVDDRTYVAEYEPSGEPVEVAGLPLRIGLDPSASYYGVAVSSFPATAGNVYVADAADNTVKVYEPGDPQTPVQSIDGAGTPQRGFHSLADSALALDPSDGHLFVADNLEPGFEAPAAVVDEFNPSGAYRGQLPHAFIDAEPSALAVDGAGNVYATNGNTEAASLDVFGPTAPADRLAVSKTGTGAGTVGSEPFGIDCGSACAAEYNTGTEVVLFAIPAAGSEFAGWSGGCSGVAFCRITLTADTAVSAEFEALPPQPLGLGVTGALSAAAAIAAAAPATTASLPALRAPRSQTEGRRHRRRHHRAGRKGHR